MHQKVEGAIIERGEGLNGAVLRHRHVDLVEEAGQDRAVVFVAVVAVQSKKQVRRGHVEDTGRRPKASRR